MDKNLKFSFNLDDQLPSEDFQTDLNLLNLIVTNLLDNSLESTSQGFVKIQVEPDARKNCI
jgi:signal transduction histidine kinase